MGVEENKVIPPIDESMKKKMDAIVLSLTEGMFKRDAALYNGVSEATYHRWCKWYPEFKEQCEKAILDYKRNLIISVNVNSVKSGKIALEVLRTRWPKEWNVAKKVQLTDPEGELQRMMRILMGTATPEDLPSEGNLEENDDEDISDIPSEDQE